MTAFLFSNARTALVTGCVAALLLAWVMWDIVPGAWLAAWVAAVFAINAVRYPLVRGLPTDGDADPSTVAWYTAGIFVSGAVWGSAGILFFMSGTIYHQVFLAFVLGGMVAGAVASYAAWLPAFYAFAVPALAPIASRYILEGDQVSAVMGGFLVLYGVALTVLAHNLNRILIRSVTLKSALGESEERFRLIAETSPVAIFISTIEDGTILFCNAAAGDLLRVPHEELIGRRVTELYKDPADRPPLVKELEEKGEFRDRPLEIVTRDGENRWVTLSGRRIAFEGKPAFLSAIVDTTDQRRADQELRDSERRYRDVVEGEVTFTLRFKPDTTLTFVNTAYAIQRQKPPRELIGKKFIDFMPDDEKNEVLAYLASFTIDQPVKSREFRALQPDGSIHWRAWTHRAFFGDDGEVAEFQAVGHDTTERKRAEEALRASEERFRDVAEASSDWFWETDGEFRYTYFSDRVKSVSGKYPHHLIGKTRWESASVDRDEDKWRAHKKDLEAHRFFRDFRYDYETTDGRLIHIQASGKPVFDAEGVFKGYRGSSSNITERVKAEKALRASEERFRSIVEGAADAIFVYDFDFRLVDVNERACQSLGYSRSELLAMSVHDVEVPIDPDESKARLSELETGTITVEGVHRRKDDSRFPVELNISRFGAAGDRLVIALARDITERKKQEQEIIEKSALLQAVLDAMSQGLSAFDKNLRLIAWNQVAMEGLDYAPDLLRLGRPLEDFFRYNAKRGEYGPGDVEEQVRERIELARKFAPHRFERTRPNGLIFEIVGNPMPEGGFVTTYTNITERVEAEQALRKSEQSYRDVVEGGTALICQFLPDTTFTFVNKAYAQNHGVAPEKLIGRKFFDWEPEDEKPALLEHLASFSVDKPLHVREAHMRRPDGSDAWAIWTNRAFFDEDGNVTHFQGVGTDITDRKRAEDALRKSEDRYLRAVEAGRVGVWEWNVKTGDIYVAPNLKAMLGYTDEEIPNRMEDWASHVHPDDANMIMAKATAHLEGETPHYDVEHRMVCKDGSTRWFATRGVAIRDKSGKPVQVIGTDTDITDRVETQQQLQQFRKVESLGSIAGGIAHEINNMLHPILSLTSTIINELPKNSQRRLLLEGVLEAANRIKNLVARILTFSRRDEIVNQPIVVRMAVEDALSLLHATVLPSIVLRQQLETSDLAAITPSDIQTILVNLVSNAEDALSGRPGQIDIALSRVSLKEPMNSTVPALPPGTYVKLTVKDRGIGMDKETTDHLFEPFFTTKEVGQGTGLGLSIVYGIVVNASGGLGVTSAPGKGTTMDVYIPTVDENGRTIGADSPERAIVGP